MENQNNQNNKFNLFPGFDNNKIKGNRFKQQGKKKT